MIYYSERKKRPAYTWIVNYGGKQNENQIVGKWKEATKHKSNTVLNTSRCVWIIDKMEKKGHTENRSEFGHWFWLVYVKLYEFKLSYGHVFGIETLDIWVSYEGRPKSKFAPSRIYEKIKPQVWEKSLLIRNK